MATEATGGGIWGHSGVASDGTNMFVITGNTFKAWRPMEWWRSHRSLASGPDLYRQPHRLLGSGQLAVAR